MTIPPQNSDGPAVIHVDERDTGVLTPLHPFEAINALFVDGVVEVKYIDALNQRILPEGCFARSVSRFCEAVMIDAMKGV